ncbi:MAG: hydrogenobyrinic acid a,c-diamide synthase (glutamine-hydrolyzing) [Proteobacteria bacterium]|nr:hydrogenobyrinic acid a,c-diamide synthase (glutamine-hydrolyzing) [Pseudomonadota bacterium]MBU1581619.1 hydrogenobyrinic acid a,c-diamide synthase (glutamine-hydrolyzing) [Pseudomonadota bacterium]MBU2454082.1 hydrogenobyrinic acid a,c-diamide synthase (glutamine-hydrolyzing) [Pseudomonadota bacterium]MBU2631924.1 hydrogenobyrinic acid a,c-diamide synthase (glutamine-hydrolyzing) [Pseudomonadota bacterium]
MQKAGKRVPGIVIAGLRGGSGKTVISLGITAAWKEKGLKVSPFKKGPDYIDAGWLSKAAGRPCYNLDTFLCTPSVVTQSYHENSIQCDIAVVEGNRGLYDGIDMDGTTSTAELAKLLNLPILLVLDCTKSTRTMAALLLGCMKFDPDINICGVILNRVAGKRHEGKVRTNIEKFCNIPVFGAVPKLKAKDFPERHMGLVTSEEHAFSDTAIRAAAKVARDTIDLDALYQTVTRQHHGSDSKEIIKTNLKKQRLTQSDPVTIGIIRDSAFQFYYPDNIEALKKLGATIVYISPLNENSIPDVHAIYMGGGFPETHAPQLAQNKTFRDDLKKLSQNGLPIYAECGGLIFLGQSIQLGDQEFPMSGIFPIKFGLSLRPQGHGYTKVEVVHENPFFKAGELLKGHEFRYSSILEIEYKDHEMAFKMERGKGIIDKKDGFYKLNTFGTYTHIHALGSPSWAPSLIEKAKAFKAGLAG